MRREMSPHPYLLPTVRGEGMFPHPILLPRGERIKVRGISGESGNKEKYQEKHIQIWQKLGRERGTNNEKNYDIFNFSNNFSFFSG
ncbi:MAG: hypothetical protein NC932_00455 [Candidatus Omnitrophica bacterium]|nr:hypothetical protein [Candidatus Omnitrophota bacterium]